MNGLATITSRHAKSAARRRQSKPKRCVTAAATKTTVTAATFGRTTDRGEQRQMTTSNNIRHFTPPVLNSWDVQIITARHRIKLLEKTLEAVRDDLELRADIGTADGDHSVNLGNSVWMKLCDVTDKYGKYQGLTEEPPPSVWKRLQRLFTGGSSNG